MGKHKSLRKLLRDAVQQAEHPVMHEVEQALRSELRQLATDGLVEFGEDHTLTGLALECRVRQLFETMGFCIRAGRDGKEDCVVECPDGVEPATPLVIEVKSSVHSSLSLHVSIPLSGMTLTEGNDGSEICGSFG